MEVLSARATGLVSYYHLLWNDIAIGHRSRGRRRKKRSVSFVFGFCGGKCGKCGRRGGDRRRQF
jgi:hypothetical protein